MKKAATMMILIFCTIATGSVMDIGKVESIAAKIIYLIIVFGEAALFCYFYKREK